MGKIGPHDIEVFEEESKPQWLARVHALERVADKVPVDNPWPCHAPFSRKKHVRYVYEQYDSTRGPTLFLPKDRLFLTRKIMLNFMDLDILEDYGAIKCNMALHDANRGEYDDLSRLFSNWVLPPLFSALTTGKAEIGGVTVDDGYEDRGDTPPCLLWLFCQPLQAIRDYFGEEVGKRTLI